MIAFGFDDERWGKDKWNNKGLHVLPPAGPLPPGGGIGILL